MMSFLPFFFIFHIVFVGAYANPTKTDQYLLEQQQKWNDYKSSQTNSWKQHATKSDRTWEDHKSKIKNIWSELKIPTVKIFVEYSADYNTRLQVDFEKGLVTIDRISDKKIDNKVVTSFMNSVLNQNDFLFKDQIAKQDELSQFTESKIQGKDGKIRNIYTRNLKLVPDHVKRRASKYIAIVNSISINHRLPRELILAIMWQESSFNPFARSHIPAFGLMQIVPRFAGNEVRNHLGETVTVDGDFLYNPENNIRYGINYLSLLSNKYFSQIDSFDLRVPFIIAGYNWGPSRLLKKIDNGKIKITNQASIINQIQSVAPAETRDYLVKVFEKWNRIKNDQWFSI